MFVLCIGLPIKQLVRIVNTTHVIAEECYNGISGINGINRLNQTWYDQQSYSNKRASGAGLDYA